MLRRCFICAVGLIVAVGVTAADAQSAFDRGWIDVNFGMANAAEDGLAVTGSRTISAEAATFRTTYSFPRGALFDFGGGVMLTPVVGVGVSVTGTAHKDNADLFARIPHPLRFNAFGEDSTFTQGELQRTEGTIHVQGMFVLPTGNDRVRVRVFGGPSYFRLKMDAVGSIAYDQAFQLFGAGNVITITNYNTVSVEETGWGFHAGADVSMFFTRVIGIGGVARFSRANIEIDDTDVLRGDPFKIKTGGFQLGGGLRLKF